MQYNWESESFERALVHRADVDSARATVLISIASTFASVFLFVDDMLFVCLILS
jgi:hypothetical protein